MDGQGSCRFYRAPALLAIAAALLPMFPAARAGEDAEPLRGNCNSDAALDISDALFLLDHLFGGGRIPECRALCDWTSDDIIDISDAQGVMEHLFLGTCCPDPVDPVACEGPRLEIEWDPVILDVNGAPERLGGYRIYAGRTDDGESPPLLLKEVGADAGGAGLTESDLAPLEPGGACWIAVTAVDAAGNESDLSGRISVTL